MDGNFHVAFSLGFAVGVILALTGAGGAIIAVPLLVFGLSLPIAEASPIALFAVAFAAFVGALMGFRNGILRYKAAMVISICGFCLSPIGLWTASKIPNGPLLGIFSVVLLYVAINMYQQARRELQGVQTDESYGPPCMLHETHGKLIWTLLCFRAMMASGAIAGFLSGLLGVGGGFVIVPALKKVTNLPARSIISTSLGAITLVSLGGVAGSAVSGVMNWSIAFPFAMGALVGMLSGRSIGIKLKGPHLQQAFAIFAFGVSICMMIKAMGLN